MLRLTITKKARIITTMEINKDEFYHDIRICDLFRTFLFKQLYTFRVYDISEHKCLYEDAMEGIIDENFFNAKIFMCNFWLDKRKNPIVDVWINPVPDKSVIPNVG